MDGRWLEVPENGAADGWSCMEWERRERCELGFGLICVCFD